MGVERRYEMKKLADFLFGFLFEVKNASGKTDNRERDNVCDMPSASAGKIVEDSPAERKQVESHGFNRESAIENAFRKFYTEKAQANACADRGILTDRKAEIADENVVKKYFKGFVGLTANADCNYDKM